MIAYFLSEIIRLWNFVIQLFHNCFTLIYYTVNRRKNIIMTYRYQKLINEWYLMIQNIVRTCVCHFLCKINEMYFNLHVTRKTWKIQFIFWKKPFEKVRQCMKESWKKNSHLQVNCFTLVYYPIRQNVRTKKFNAYHFSHGRRQWALSKRACEFSTWSIFKKQKKKYWKQNNKKKVWNEKARIVRRPADENWKALALS